MTAAQTDICVIEDDASQRRLLTEQLRRSDYVVVGAADGPAGLQAIYAHHPKVVVCDLQLPVLDGIQVCRRVRSDPTLDGVYFVVVTASHDPAARRRALNAGADDYLEKPFDLVELRARIRNGMRIQRLQDRLQRAALTDGLTELWNHTQFRNVLEREFARAQRYGGVLSLLMIDLDHFKAVNDTFGHELGNEVLRMVAAHLTRTVRDSDIVARYGGEEFAVICPETNLAEAAQLAERLRATLATQVHLRQQPGLLVRASIGVACTSAPGVGSAADLISLGDQALYMSKRRGRDRVVSSDELSPGDDPADCPTDEVDRLRKEVYALTIRSKELCLQSIWALIQALDARDRYTAWHSRNVTQYVEWLVDAAGWPPALRAATANAAMLHDLGKIGLSDELLTKPRPLSEHELEMLREVPQVTCRILEPLRVFETEIEIIRHLREHYDGTGAPDALVGEEIPIGSRLLAIAEAFDAMTCNRAYRAARSIDEALAEIAAQAGVQFDPELTLLLLRSVEQGRGRWQSQVERACAAPPARWTQHRVG